MDFDLGDQAAALRTRLRELISAHIAEDYLGAFTSDPADLDVAQRFCRTLADEGLLTIAWPAEYGGGGGSWWAHISSRTTVWSHSEPPPPPYSAGQAMVRSPSSARVRQNRWATSRSAGSLVNAPR